MMARDLKFWIEEVEGLYYVVKTKALISCAIVFAYAKNRISHDAAHMLQLVPILVKEVQMITYIFEAIICTETSQIEALWKHFL